MNGVLADFESITLGEMKDIRLMNRTDTKFVTNIATLRVLLNMAKGDYRIQEINGERNISYYTVYFDTHNFDMFSDHQDGRSRRQKVRIRSYINSHLNFLEVKTKDNHGRTGKKRIEIYDFNPRNPESYRIFNHQTDEIKYCEDFLKENLSYGPESLGEKIENKFNRITLVNRAKTERLTIDTKLQFHNLYTGNDCNLDNIAVVELKRDGLQYSPVLDMLRDLRIQPLGFSKYCVGSALTDKNLKQNRFKPRIRRIYHILES